MNIFELLNQKGIITIPSIQRDYAYGRESEKTIAQSLVNSILEVLKDKAGEKKLRLNYIYGVPKTENSNNIIILIDGQQRTTTLFLIGLYLCNNADDTTNIQEFNVENFSYETRTTTKDFCAFLRNEGGTILKCDGISVKEKIKNNKSFFKRWMNDPTIYSMLEVLDIIDSRFKDIKKEERDFNSWLTHLQNITFEYISLDSFKREESLYSTMNGRGKQLTEFEQIKSDIFELYKNSYPDIEDIINNKWIPAFWDYARNIETDEKEKDKYAAKKHDCFLYNYFKYVVTMAYWENYEITETNKTPNLVEMIKEIKGLSVGDKKEKILDIISFSMNDFRELSEVDFSKYLANYHVNECDDKVNVFWTFKYDLIGQCCKNEEFANIERCLLWAFIIYMYNKNKTGDKKDLRDYFVLIRDVFASWWDSNTPTATGKSPKEHQVATGVRAFHQIVDGTYPLDGIKDCYQNQKRAFDSENKEKYRILNNICTRGCSNNIIEIVTQENYSQEQSRTFAENIDFLINNAKNNNNETRFTNLIALETIGIKPPYFVCNKNKEKRLYLPFSENMLQSFFSMGDWKSSNDYDRKISVLANSKLEEQKRKYTESDWQWYIMNYSECFMYDDSYCAFDFCVTEKNDPKFYSLTGVYGTRASAKQSVSPYILAAYREYNHIMCKIDKKMIEDCIKEIKKMGISIIEENEHVYVESDAVNKNGGEWDKRSSFVEFIESFFENQTQNS